MDEQEKAEVAEFVRTASADQITQALVAQCELRDHLSFLIDNDRELIGHLLRRQAVHRALLMDLDSLVDREKIGAPVRRAMKALIYSALEQIGEQNRENEAAKVAEVRRVRGRRKGSLSSGSLQPGTRAEDIADLAILAAEAIERRDGSFARLCREYDKPESTMRYWAKNYCPKDHTDRKKFRKQLLATARN